MAENLELNALLQKFYKAYIDFVRARSFYDYMTNEFMDFLIHWMRLETTSEVEAAELATELWWEAPLIRPQLQDAYYCRACFTLEIPIYKKPSFCQLCDEKIIIRNDKEEGSEICHKCKSICDRLFDDWHDHDRLKVIELVLAKRNLLEMPYSEYLQTEHWKKVREIALSINGRACQLCNSTNNLNVHHRDYSNRAFETPIDLTILCQKCHAKFHGKDK